MQCRLFSSRLKLLTIVTSAHKHKQMHTQLLTSQQMGAVVIFYRFILNNNKIRLMNVLLSKKKMWFFNTNMQHAFKGDLKLRCRRNFMDSFQCGIFPSMENKKLTKKKFSRFQKPFGMNPFNSCMTVKTSDIFIIHTNIFLIVFKCVKLAIFLINNNNSNRIKSINNSAKPNSNLKKKCISRMK